MTNSAFRKFGNLLIILSIFGYLVIYSPVLIAYLNPPPYDVLEAIPEGFVIDIPRLKLREKIVDNVDPFNSEEYSKKLKEGIAHAKGTYYPGDKKKIFLFGHSSDYPWNITRYNTVFLKLNDLENSDKVILFKDGVKYEYEVFKKLEVWPSEVKYLKENLNEDVLILQTCTPIGTALKRLLIFAKPQNL